MYTHTHHTYLVYTWNGTTFKVPTFGKIYKIIDFGRAIYRFRGRILCSDSFHPKGDAASQYNCEPYLNKHKPILEPNFSFDLCRLGCSLFDVISEDIDYTSVKDTDNTPIELNDINVRMMGESNWTGSNSRMTPGKLDDVRIYDKALTEDEVLDLYNTRGAYNIQNDTVQVDDDDLLDDGNSM